jgi:hypothetical protein
MAVRAKKLESITVSILLLLLLTPIVKPQQQNKIKMNIDTSIYLRDNVIFGLGRQKRVRVFKQKLGLFSV